MTTAPPIRRAARVVTIGAVATLVAATATISATAQATNVTTSVAAAVSDQQLTQFRDALRERGTRYASDTPVGPNPSTSLVPPGTPRDYQGWAEQSTRLAAQRMASQATKQARSQENQRVLPGITATEDEPAGTRGSNDTRANADVLEGFGTDQNPSATLLGTQSPEVIPDSALKRIAPNTEDDSTPELARDTGIAGTTKGIRTTGFRGDSPTMEDPGEDDDFYRLTLAGGERLSARMTATSGTLEPIMVLVDEDLNFITDTFYEWGTDVRLNASIPKAGTYYLIATGWTVFGAPPEGPTTGKYSLKVAAGGDDRDVWSVDLAAGDVLGATLDTPGYVSVSGPKGTETHRSAQDASYIYPLDSPLPGATGYANADYVVPKDGRYFVEFGGGSGPYQGKLEVYRHGGEGAAAQTIFLDTDGARVNTRIWGGGYGVVNLSPLSSFMGKWGLTKAQEPVLVRAIKKNLEENLRADLAAAGLSDSVALNVVSSADGVDLTGQPGVTRIILGGTIAESGIGTIGIAESIDPGNFGRTETGLVLLDSLSEPGNRRKAPYSLNSYPGPGAKKLSFVAQGLGNVTSHEVGHMIGNWHTDNANGQLSLMDAGGNFAQMFGVGPDRIGGTADDRDVDFTKDTYAPWEGFIGREDTTARSAFGMSR